MVKNLLFQVLVHQFETQQYIYIYIYIIYIYIYFVVNFFKKKEKKLKKRKAGVEKLANFNATDYIYNKIAYSNMCIYLLKMIFFRVGVGLGP